MRYAPDMPASRPPHDPLAPRLSHDPLADRTVFVAPARGTRPRDGDRSIDRSGPGPFAWCPFCPGSEALTPTHVARLPDDPAAPWRARIVPNRYPVVVESGADDGAPARGVHEVVIESARHARTVGEVAADDWRSVWEMVRRRLEAVAARGDVAWSLVFKNAGAAAGASLEHLHSQLVGIDFVPPTVRAKLAACRQHGFAAAIAEARAAGRIVAEADGLVALVPPAARQPFETQIVTTDPDPFFHATAAGRVAGLAELTRLVCARLERVAPGTDFNWWLHQHPHHEPLRSDWHWHLEMLPRISPLAGFELATGCHISTLDPVEAAARLRSP